MNRILAAVVAVAVVAQSEAQLWDGSSLPPAWSGVSSVDSYFSDAGSPPLSEFDSDTGIEFSLQEYGTKPSGINGANGWSNAANFAVTLEAGDTVIVTFLGKTAGWLNDFGLNLGGSNAYGAGASTLWSSIDNGTPPVGDQFSFTMADDSGPTSIDFWLNSDAAPMGGTYSVFDPSSSVPWNSGLPDFNYSAFGKLFDVFDDGAGAARRVLVVAIEDWRDFDADFTDMFFAIEIYDRTGESQFPVPEPSTYGLIGAALLMGLVAIRRMRRS
jgi:hypothetical protein